MGSPNLTYFLPMEIITACTAFPLLQYIRPSFTAFPFPYFASFSYFILTIIMSSQAAGYNEEVDEEMRRIDENRIAPKSKAIYKSAIIAFIVWIFEKRPALLTREFLNGMQHNTNIKEYAAYFLERAPLNTELHPIKFEELQAEDFKRFLLSITKRDGKKPGFSSYSTHRSALFDLFRMYKLRMSNDLSFHLSIFFSGLRRTHATAIANGDGEIVIGKHPLAFMCYRTVAKEFLKKDGKEHIFGHLFMVMCWNLMCRSSNVVKICFSHMSWFEDALGIRFAHQKTDQSGTKPRDLW